MTKEERIYRRVLRRETHASRTGSASVVSVLILVVVIALIAAGVWWAVNASFRDTVATQAVALTSGPNAQGVLIAVGVVALLLALLLLVLALTPGRLARRARVMPRGALLVDDGVLADAIADAVALNENVDRRQVSVTLGRRTTHVLVTPTSGVPVDTDRVARVAEHVLARLGFSAATRVRISDRGVIA